MLTTDQIKANLAKNVRARMFERGISQTDLAAKVGESQVNISRLVLAKHVPNVLIVARIAAFFGTSVDILLREPAEN